MVAGQAVTVRAPADGAGIVTVAAGASGALVVMTIVFMMQVPVVNVVHVTAVDDGRVAAARTVGVTVRLSGRVTNIRVHGTSCLAVAIVERGRARSADVIARTSATT